MPKKSGKYPPYSDVSIEEFLVEELPHLLQEHKETIETDSARTFVPGRLLPESAPIIQHQYHHARPVWIKAIVTYRAEVGGKSTYSGKSVEGMLLLPFTEEGTTRLREWLHR